MLDRSIRNDHADLIREDESAWRALAGDDATGVVAYVLDVIAAGRLLFDDVVQRDRHDRSPLALLLRRHAKSDLDLRGFEY